MSAFTAQLIRASTDKHLWAREYDVMPPTFVKRGVGAVDPVTVASAYFALGDRERGFEWLTKAFDQRSGGTPYVNVFPTFDGVRSDSRFKALVTRLKLPN